MGSKYFDTSSYKVDLGQESFLCNGDSIHQKTKEELSRCKEEIRPNLLSDADFYEHFKSEISQRNIGNCWLISAINSLRLNVKYKELIQKSVKKVPDGFEIILPLGAPYPYGKLVKVSQRELYPQISIGGDELMSLDGKDGLKALVLAYGKVSTGKDVFDIRALDEGYGGTYFNTLVYGVSSYSRWRNTHIQNTQGKWIINKAEDIGFTTEITRALSIFSPENMMTVAIPIARGKQVDNLLDYRNSPENLKENHEFTVDSVIREGGKIKQVILINPWDSRSPFSLSFEQFKKLTISYTFGAYDPRVFGLTHTKDTDIGKRNVLGNSDGKIEELSLDQIINKYPIIFGGFFRSGRGDSVIRLIKDRYYIDSWGYTDTSLGKGFSQGLIEHSIKSAGGFDPYFNKAKNNQRDHGNGELTSVYLSHIIAYSSLFREGKIDYILRFGSHELNFGKKNPFSDAFAGKKEEVFRYSLYPALLSIFINQIRLSFIDERVKKPILPPFLPPFYINDNGSLSISDSRIIDTIMTQKNSKQQELISDWGMFGISQDDATTKSTIVDFLNKIYFSSIPKE